MTGRDLLRLLFVALLALPLRAQEPEPAGAREARDLARRIESRVAAMRGLEFRSPTRVGVHTLDGLRKVLEEEIAKESGTGEARDAARAWARLGLLPAGTDLERLMLDLLAGQVAGFYDPEKKELFLIRRPEGQSDEDRITMSHELVHALQDQHFDLLKFLDEDMSADEIQARRAVVEGDATISMFLFEMGGTGPIKLMVKLLPTTRDGFRTLTKLGELLGAIDLPGGDKLLEAPRVIADGMLFEYMAGAKFCAELLSSDPDGSYSFDGIDRAFRAPPLSTEQILHPAKYRGKEPDWPTAVTLPDLSKELKGCRLLDSDSLGELHVRTWLTEHGVRRKGRVHRGWDGDRFAVWGGDEGEDVLVWASTWDTPRDAEEFYQAVVDVERREARRNLRVVSVSETWGTDVGGADLHLRVMRRGREVFLLDSVSDAAAETIWKRITDETRFTPRTPRSSTGRKKKWL